MSIFSYQFFGLWIITFAFYFGFAKRWQWQVLTVSSVLFYALSINRVPAVLLVVWMASYFGANYIVSHRSRAKTTLYTTVCVLVFALIFGRSVGAIATVGNSYFTLKAIGYVIDVYRDEEYEKNPFKYLLFLIYFPGVLEGPFNRIKEFRRQIDVQIKFDYLKLAHGCQRFLWGAFKKLVISQRLEMIATAVLSEPSGKGGFIVLAAVATYALQLYTDFSGFMDMMLGVSITLGISLPENFRQPFFSKSVPEFWRRWHITLGLWFRDYIMFPLTSSHIIKSTAKKVRRKYKMLGKLFPTIIATIVVWLLTGLWHGSGVNYIIWGIYYAVLMCASQIYNAVRKNKIKEKNTSYIRDLVSILRTVVLVIIADSFVCVNDISSVKLIWKEILLNFAGGSMDVFRNAGIGKQFAAVTVVCLAVLFVNSYMDETSKSIQKSIDASPLWIRWVVYYVLFFAVVLLGMYGSQYDVSQFMYMQF